MPFLKNAWYVAAWNDELGDVPLARTLLGEPVVFYRDANGAPVALRDACPHRFAPLSRGKILDGGRIQCPYHGIEFDSSGACVHNPNGRGALPAALSVRNYPLRTVSGAIWIWFGDTEVAARTDPPRYSFLDQEGFSVVRGNVYLNAHYELVTDNLLDLTHVDFLHPFLANPGEAYTTIFRVEQVGDRVSAFHSMPKAPMSPLWALFFDPSVTHVEGRTNMHWEAPANLMLDGGAKVAESAEGALDVALPSVHLLTPETEATTHYFWGVARNRHTDNPQIDEMLRMGASETFRNEDEPMIRAVFERMGGKSLFELSPALLPQDEASVRARRILAKKIAADENASALA